MPAVIVPLVQVTVDVTFVVEIGSSGMAVEEQETGSCVRVGRNRTVSHAFLLKI
jgi:hypothetical protein